MTTRFNHSQQAVRNSITRRELLATASFFSAASLMSPTDWCRSPKARRCVIVGAGLAGLSAAFKLQSAGWDVTVVEAQSRIGGRVFSYSLPQNPNLICELGAEWIGENHTRVLDLCQQFKIPIQTHRFQDRLIQNQKLSLPGNWDFSPTAQAAWKKMMAEYPKLTDAEKVKLDQIDWWTYLAEIGFTPEDLRLRDLADSTDFGESIRHVSAYAAMAEYAESSEMNEMDFKIQGGNSRLVEELVKRIGRNNIITNASVSKIVQRPGGVTVITATGEYQADACICTAPTASVRRIEFVPPLPEDQAMAFRQLTYSRIIKNSVLYANRFWNDEDFSLLSDTTSHYYFHSTQKQLGQQGILTAYAIGDKADVLASLDDSRKIETITRDLCSPFPQAGLLARGIAAYAWQRDAYTSGAYALYRPGQWFGLRPILQQPHQKVLFAGEHLADWQGFMEGAVETGEAAAEWLLS